MVFTFEIAASNTASYTTALCNRAAVEHKASSNVAPLATTWYSRRKILSYNVSRSFEKPLTLFYKSLPASSEMLTSLLTPDTGIRREAAAMPFTFTRAAVIKRIYQRITIERNEKSASGSAAALPPL